MSTKCEGKLRWQIWGLVLPAMAVLAGTIWLVTALPNKEGASDADPSPSSKRTAYARDAFLDDSGNSAAQWFMFPVQNPLSLQSIRDAYAGAGYRGIDFYQSQLANGLFQPQVRVEMLSQIALLLMYEGDFVKAAETLKEVRALAEADPDRFGKGLPTVIFLQGMAAFRRGETENCVNCPCESSCIFPLRPQAVHRKPEGSRQAVDYFTEYLQHHPEDLGVRWLLNLAYMTLGEYPDRVPAPYLIPLAPFQSEFDLGRFTDIAPKLGVDRLNQAGGAIMDDFDNDGLLDIITTTWEEGVPMAFYRNRGDGTFEDRTRAAGLDLQVGGLYCVQTDYNNDGWLDIYICRGAWKCPMRHSLLRNNRDGTFTDVTAEAGLLTPVASQVAVWADYDNDGWLDLFVGGESYRRQGTEVTGRSYLYHNRGDGTFEEVALSAGVANEGFTCKGASWGDFDGDGYPDLFVSNNNGPPRLFHNNGDGTFTDVAPQLGITKPEHGFSCWFWDYDNDGWLDIFVTSYDRAKNNLSDQIKSQLGQPVQGETPRLYHNLGQPAQNAGRGAPGAERKQSGAARSALRVPRFEDVTKAVGLDLVLSPMGSNFVDVDNDGFLDFYLGTGGIMYSMLVPNRLFKNVQGKRFADITASSGTGHLQKGHAIACGDWDRDGNVDLYVGLGGASPGDRFRNVLFQNPGHANHWITVKLVGKKTNRPAIGARIKVTVPGGPPNTFYRHVTSGSSFGANSLQQTIGIGKADKIASLEVYWPSSKTTQVFADVPIDQAIEITEFAPDYRRLNWSRIPLPK